MHNREFWSVFDGRVDCKYEDVDHMFFADGRSESPSQCNPFQCELSAAVYALLWIWEKEGIDRFIGPSMVISGMRGQQVCYNTI